MKFIAQAIPRLFFVLVVVVAAASVSDEETDDGSILISPTVYEFPPTPNDDLLTDAEQTNDDGDMMNQQEQFSSRMGQAETLTPRRLPPGPHPPQGQQNRRNIPVPGSFEEDSAEEGPEDEKSRGIFSYKTKTHYVQKNIPSKHHRGPPVPHLGPAAYELPKRPPHRGWGHPPPPHHPHHRHPKVPHYVKYWEQNHAPHHHLPQRKKQGWKTYSKPNPFAPGYWVNLAERLADGVGLLPEYGKEEHKVGPHKHGKYHFKGITLHNGFFTEVL